VSQQVRLLGEELRADDAVVERHARSVAGSQKIVGQSWMCSHVLDVAGLVAVSLVTDAARIALLATGRRRRRARARAAATRRRRGLFRLRTGALDEVGQRPTAREHAPVVGMIFVDVTEEANLVGAVLLADLASQVVRASKTRVQLNSNTTQPNKHVSSPNT